MTETEHSEAEGTVNREYVRLAKFVGGALVLGVVSQLVWLTTEAFESKAFRLSGDQYTAHEAARYKDEVESRFNALPSPETRRRLEAVESQYKTLNDGQQVIQTQLRVMEAILQRIDKKM